MNGSFEARIDNRATANQRQRVGRVDELFETIIEFWLRARLPNLVRDIETAKTYADLLDDLGNLMANTNLENTILQQVMVANERTHSLINMIEKPKG